MEDTLAERHDFTASKLPGRQNRKVCPHDQICFCHDDFEPGRVGVKSVERQVVQNSGFGLTNPVLDVRSHTPLMRQALVQIQLHEQPRQHGDSRQIGAFTRHARIGCHTTPRPPAAA